MHSFFEGVEARVAFKDQLTVHGLQSAPDLESLSPSKRWRVDRWLGEAG
jgi:hypothetical protein